MSPTLARPTARRFTNLPPTLVTLPSLSLLGGKFVKVRPDAWSLFSEADRRIQWGVPITVFDAKGIPATRREGMEAARVAAGRHVSAPHEAWIAGRPAARRVQGPYKGPHGLERSISLALDEEPVLIVER
jgi:hypothetical protein